MRLGMLWGYFLVLEAVAPQFAKADQPKPPMRESESLDATLVRKGYERVPLRVVSEQDSSFLAVIACGKQQLKLVLDTGSTITLLDSTTAKRLGLKPRADLAVKALTPRGELKIEPAAISELEFGGLTLSEFGIHIADLSASRPAGEPESAKPDGILGQDFLAHLSAVIDYDRPAMYVIAPVDKEWPGLKGEWVCTAGTRDGKPLADTEHWRFHFGDKGKARITNAGDGADVPLAADILSFGKDRVLTLARPKADKPARLPFAQEAIWMQYSVKGDTLKVAFLLQPKDPAVLADRVPVAVESKAGSGVVVLEFTRPPKPPEKK